MKAIVIHKAKDLRLDDVEAEAPARGQVLVRMRAGGICGSDLHYYQHGGFGAITLKEPMVLGHEVAGVVAGLGEGVNDLSEGDLVAVSPSRPCGQCKYCTEGTQNQCLNMRFYGSAMPFPHIQGAFREELVVDVSQCVPAGNLSAAEAAMAEPLAVCLHAAGQAGEMLGKRVLITGAGPIGTLSTLIARRAGAREIVVTDLAESALDFAQKAGADKTINMADAPLALDQYSSDKGAFDVLFECSGSPLALAGGIGALRPKGVIVQLGLGGDMSLPMMQITAKELQLRGSFRFHEEFGTAVALMRQGLIDVKPLISHSFALEDAVAAFEMASDRTQAMKAQIVFK